ncbi:putative ccch zinc finger protein [Golovinomyces cichoracearum]|uniref:Putative ccch zinc finger protein n=1 Tax=Golovinomyces cichoracearum TaxID=62708 RepID=A0A420IB32_9PEZI|nr:putative ccch zinc finger protein [Golovinomyces cichoracearum]
MVRPQQYKFPPPPLPPTPSSSNPHVQQYGYPQQTPPFPQHQQRGGGGNHNNRIETHGSSSQNITHHLNDSYDHRQPQQPQASFPPSRYNSSLSSAQISTPYIGPQPGPPTQQGYPSTRWPNIQHSPQHGPNQPQQPHMFYSSQPTPLSVQNYHPNYAPQTYQQPHYSASQPPFQAQPPSYGHSVPPNQQPQMPPHVAPQTAPQQWQGTPQHVRPPFTGHRGRGGFSNTGRGSHDSPALLMGPPIRMGFDNDRGGGHMAQASNGFTNSHVIHHPHANFPQPPIHSYPPQDFPHVVQRLPSDTNQYSSPQKSRGGSTNFKGKSRTDSHQSHSRNRTDNRHHQSSGAKSTNENYPKVYGTDSTVKKKKKRKTNTLGLTPNGPEHEDSDDEVDDIDEEARLVTLLGADTPQLPIDLQVWLAERKKKFPTKSRREAALEQACLRREEAHESKQKKSNSDKSVKKEGETKLEKQQRKAEKLRLELEKAERKIQQEISGSKRKRDNGDEGDDDRGQVSDNDSESSSSSDSDDKPEALSTHANNTSRIHPPKAQLQRHCKYFSTGGTCGKKGKCRFLHDHEVRNQALRDKEANGGKMTLAQRLILNDTAKDDLTILKSIKYLKEKGLMPDQLTGSTSQDGDESRVKDSENDDEGHSHSGD